MLVTIDDITIINTQDISCVVTEKENPNGSQIYLISDRNRPIRVKKSPTAVKDIIDRALKGEPSAPTQPANAKDSEEKCPTLAFNGINKQASEINSALDAENERLNWKVEKMRESLRLIRGHALNNSGSYLGIIYEIAKRAMEETE